jgi:hypothetical protein
VASSFTPLLSGNALVNDLVLTSGAVDLAGYTLTVLNNLSLQNGTVLGSGLLQSASPSATSIILSPVVVNPSISISTATITIMGATFNASAIFAAADIFPFGGTYNGPVKFTKTGGGTNHNAGSLNIFNSTCTIDLQSSTGMFGLGFFSADQFNGDLILNSSANNDIIIGDVNGVGTPSLTNGTILIGSGGFSNGEVSFNHFTKTSANPVQLLLTSGTTAMLIGKNSVFNGKVDITTPRIFLYGVTFLDTVTLTKTGSVTDASPGGNLFSSKSNFINNSAGSWMLGFNNPDTFNDVSFSTFGTGIIYPSAASTGNLFQGNIELNNANSQAGVYFGVYGGTSTLTAGKSISSGTIGFTAGDLRLAGITQLGSTSTSITVAGNSALYIGPNCIWNAPTTFSAADIYLWGATFNSSVAIIKTGGSFNSSANNQNTFNNIVTITQQSSTGDFALGYNSTDSFNDNIFLNSSGASAIIFGNPSGLSTPNIAPGKSIFTGNSGFSNGSVQFYGFIQNGTAPINLSLSGATTTVVFAKNSTFGGNVNISAPSFYLNGAIFNGSISLTKTGSSNDVSYGGNTYNGLSSFINQGSGFFALGNVVADSWNSDVTFNTTNGWIYPCYNSPNNQFNGNIYVNSSGASPGITFCLYNSATASLTSGNKISTGASGFNTGRLSIQRFTQLGATPCSLTLTGNAALYTGPSTTWNGSFSVTAPDIYVTGTNFMAPVYFKKTGGSFNHNNTATNNFYSTCTIDQQSSTGYFGLSHYSNDNFMDDIIINSSAAGEIVLGDPGGNGNPQLSSGKTIVVGSGGFNAGGLQLNHFTQNGTTPINLNFSGTSAYIWISGNSIIGGNLFINSPRIFFNGATFNGNVSATKTGNINDGNSGNNTFNGSFSLTNTSTFGNISLANFGADNYNSDVFFTQTGTAPIYPNYNANCNYAGNINVSSPNGTKIYFGLGGINGAATFIGSAQQVIQSDAFGNSPVFNRLILNKTGGKLTLNVTTEVTGTLTLIKGVVASSSSTPLFLRNGAFASLGNNSSFVEGPVKFEMAFNGQRSLNFPVGKGSDWRPMILTTSHNNGTSYSYIGESFNASAAAFGWATPVEIYTVSSAHYWNVDRVLTASGVSSPTNNLGATKNIALYYDTNDGVATPTQIVICKNSSSSANTWVNIGGSGSGSTTGSIVSTSTPSPLDIFGRFTLGFLTPPVNILPIELGSFEAKKNQERVDLKWFTYSEKNSKEFWVEKTLDGQNITTVCKIAAVGQSQMHRTYSCFDAQPYSGMSYYRLKMIDLDQTYKFTDWREINIEGSDISKLVHFPSDGNTFSYLIFRGNSSVPVNLKIVIRDALGRLIKEHQVSLAETNNFTHQLNWEPLVEGVYYITAYNAASANTFKFILKR